MDNRDLRAAWHYHDGTKHSYASVRGSRHTLDWANQPLPFKIYRTLVPIPLARQAEASGMAALDALAGEDVEPWDATPDLPALARLLHLSGARELGVATLRREEITQALALASRGARWMPVYEFECPKCSKQFELVRPMSKAAAAARCPKCKAKAQRKFTATIITTGVSGGDFDLDDMPDFGGGDDQGGMPDMGGMGDDFDF